MKYPSVRRDLELLLVVLFWGFNITVVKVCLTEMGPLAFNALRFAGASLVLLALTRWLEGSLRIARRDMPRILRMAIVGHTLYQMFFVFGLAHTTASATALIFGSTPMIVGLLSTLVGQERMGVLGGSGAVVGMYGVFLVVRGSGPLETAGSRTSLLGPILVLCAVVCWSIYTILAKRLLERYSPLRVSAVTLSIGAVLLAPFTVPDLVRQDWSQISTRTWSGLVYSFLFALVICYVLWYRSVKAVGNFRTAIYRNLVPVFGVLFGFWLLGEELTTGLAMGASCILVGIILTRMGHGGPGKKPSSAQA